MAPIRIHITRELVMFAVGLAGFIHEVEINPAKDRPAIVYGSMALMGISSFLHGANITIGKS